MGHGCVPHGVLAMLALASCVESGVAVCASGRVCSPGLVCDAEHDTCVDPGACVEAADGTPCVALGVPRGHCFAQACLAAVVAATGEISAPAVASNGDDFALAWSRSLDGWTGDVEFLSAGRAEPLIISENERIAQGVPQLAANGAGTGYAATWFTRRDQPGQVDINTWRNTLLALDSIGGPIGTAVTQPSPADAASIAWTGDDWAVTWPDGTYGNWEISLQRYTAALAPLFAPRMNVSRSAGQDFGPRVAVGGELVALAWYERIDQPTFTRHVRLALRAGRGATDAPVIDVTSSPDEDLAGIRVATGAATFGVSWATVRPRPGAPDEFRIFFRPYATDGRPMSETPIPLSTDAQFSAQLAFLNGHYVLVWSQASAIKLARLTEEGAIVDITDLLTGLPTTPDGIAVTAVGDRLLLAWREGVSPSYAVVYHLVPAP